MAGVDLGIGGLSDAEPVGSGGNAVVYRAREIDHDRWVAVKVLRGLADEAALRRFDRERRAMGRLSEHDGIVTIYSSGFTDNGEPYLVMPLLGGSLQDQVDQSGPMEWRRAADMMAVVARTVDVAHAQDVIHRDLKPGNILLSPGGAPLVADFGIARLTGSTTAAQSTALTFTPSFSAPEVLEGAAPSKAADIYGLGATLYALITGTPPFATDTDESVFAVMQRIATQPVTDLRPQGVPDRVCAVIEEAMHKDPEQRHSGAADFGAALETSLATATASVGVGHDTTILDPTAAAVTAAHHGSADTTAIDQVDRAGSAVTPPPRPETETKRPWSTIAVVLVLLLALGASAAAVIIALSDDQPESTIPSDGDDPPSTADDGSADTATQDTTAPGDTASQDTTPGAGDESADDVPTTVQPTPEPTLPPIVRVPAPAGPPFGSWGVIADSFADCTAPGVISSSEYPSLTPDLCVELSGTAGTEVAALGLAEPCVSAGCYVRYLGSGPASGRWIVVWETLATDQFTYAQAQAAADAHDAQRALEFDEHSRVLLGDEYVTFADGQWLVFSRDFATRVDALDWCIEIQLTPCDVQQVLRVDGD